MTKTIEIYTDGACRGNPGPGGWGALLIAGRHRKTMHGGEADTTNNRMELTAAIEALNALKGTRARSICTRTPSTSWTASTSGWTNWKRRGWKTAAKKPVKNKDLWQALDAAIVKRHDIEWKWVRWPRVMMAIPATRKQTNSRIVV